ncbi:UNVERIFIED_CONTAM: hypothetical protein Sradi_6005700 [Sesamum radiatum]|uniref:Uncharacterized protein n=1 Tax=Sesamum radiatum TaxID=300843 RepID=A0AAW2KGC3_SESRA
MASPPPEHSADWVFDYALLEDMPPLDPTFRWPYTRTLCLLLLSKYGIRRLFCRSRFIKEHTSRKRLRSGASGASDSKAYKEKVRRDRLNDRQDLFPSTEKNELRDEKLKLKAEKEKLEEQVKALSLPSGFSVHPLPVPAPFAAPSPLLSSKLVPLFRYPGIPMWQFMPLLQLILQKIMLSVLQLLEFWTFQPDKLLMLITDKLFTFLFSFC